LNKPLQSLHAHNEAQKSDEYIKFLQNGQSIALISDAGTPLISDPGFPLVRKARQENIKVVPIPGACAITTALSASGIPCDRFLFEGFLPAKQNARCERLKLIAKSTHTTVLYESTHRILECIQDMQTLFPLDRQCVLAKELTKSFETFVNGTPTQILEWLTEDPLRCKGEFVLIISPAQEEEDTAQLHDTLITLLDELPLKQAVKIAVKLTGVNKNAVYQTALELKSK